jgi:hypothetical protein
MPFTVAPTVPERENWDQRRRRFARPKVSIYPEDRPAVFGPQPKSVGTSRLQASQGGSPEFVGDDVEDAEVEPENLQVRERADRESRPDPRVVS